MDNILHIIQHYYDSIKKFFTTRYDLKEYILQIGISLVIGTAAGLGAMVFHTLIEWMRFAINPSHFSGYLEIPSFVMSIVPVIGALMIIGLTRLFPQQASERGVTNVIKSVLLQKIPIPFFTTLFHLIASAVTLGTGAPLGPEGPSAKIGGGLGSYISSLFRLNIRKMTTYTVAGAGAAISAIFNAPIAGVFFGIEVILLNDLKNESLSALVIASVSADMVSKAYLGNVALLQIPKFQVNTGEVFYFILLAMVCGIIALLFMELSHIIRKFYKKVIKDDTITIVLPLSLLFAIAVMFFTDIYGIGYELINKVLAKEFSVNFLFILFVLKITFVALYFQTGAYGGLFAPSLCIGILVGYLFASMLSFFGVTLDPVAYALIGMGGMLAGLNSIPITAILMVFELTNDYRIILPSMLASVISHLTVTYYNKGTIYELELLEEGIDVRKSRINVLESVNVRSIASKDFQTITTKAPLKSAMDKLIEVERLVVVDDKGGYTGILSLNEVRQALLSSDVVELLICQDIVLHVNPCTESYSAAEALRRMDEYGIDFLPVVKENKVTAIVLYRDIISMYNKIIVQIEGKQYGHFGI